MVAVDQGYERRTAHINPVNAYRWFATPPVDMIEVLDPTYEADFTVDGTLTKMRLPLIKVLGRSVDVLDYEVKDESGNLLGNKVYSRHIIDALQGAQNVRWWEVFVGPRNAGVDGLRGDTAETTERSGRVPEAPHQPPFERMQGSTAYHKDRRRAGPLRARHHPSGGICCYSVGDRPSNERGQADRTAEA